MTLEQERDAARARAEVLRAALADILRIYEMDEDDPNRSDIVVALAHAEGVVEQTDAQARAGLQEYPATTGVCASCRGNTERQTLTQLSCETYIETAHSTCRGCGVLQFEVRVSPHKSAALELSWWDDKMHRLAHHRGINGLKP